MKTVVVLIMSFMTNFAMAEVFNLNGYTVDHKIKDIKQYSPGIYGIYINYDLTGDIKRNFINYCLLEKDTSISQPLACTKNKSGNYITNYMKMYILVDINNKTSCIVNMACYDNKNNLLQLSPLTTLDKCQWAEIAPKTSIDAARVFITNHKDKINLH